MGEEVLTYADVAALHARWAGWLRTKGVTPGERVGVHLGNSTQFVLAFLGTLRAGCVHVPVNPMFQHAELVHELTDSGASVVVTHPSLAERLLPAAAQAGVTTVVVVGGEVGSLRHAGVDVVAWEDALAADPLVAPATDLDVLAALNYTGGTTGLPKGCECPASRSWQDFLVLKVGDARVVQAQVHLLGPVPGDGLLRSQFVVLDAVVLGVLGEHDGVVDLVDEEPLILQRPEPTFA
ncbi:AMP-binding protein [Janibacter indicus]